MKKEKIIERIEYIVGTNIEKIKEEIEKMPNSDSREMLELRYGLKDGKCYTIDEIKKILSNKKISDEELKCFEDDKEFAKKFGIELFLNNWRVENIVERLAIELNKLIVKFNPNRFDYPGGYDLENKIINSEKERLSLILGKSDEEINNAIDKLLILNQKEIIEMHYGLNGKSYTLSEIVDKLNLEKLTKLDKEIEESYKEIAFLFDFNLFHNNWTLEKVIKEEIKIILRLRQFLLN